MCGFGGCWGPPASDLMERVDAMATAISHRGPDDPDVWVDERAGVALAHRRLAGATSWFITARYTTISTFVRRWRPRAVCWRRPVSGKRATSTRQLFVRCDVIILVVGETGNITFGMY